MVGTDETVPVRQRECGRRRVRNAAINLDHGFVLRLFPAGTRGEDWRLFEPKTDASHLVVSGGAVLEILKIDKV